MSADRALRRAVLANPADDLPRLVYADWLDEAGRADRAEFVRAGCRLAEVPPDDPDHLDLAERADDLRTVLAAELAAEQPDRRGFEWEEVARGFPSAVAVNPLGRGPCRKLLAGLAAARRAAPVDELRVRHWSVKDLAALLREPALATLRCLIVQPYHEHDGDEIAARVAACEHLAGLRDLRLFADLTDDGLAALAASPHLGRLHTFMGQLAGVTPGGLRTLAAGWPMGLREFSPGESLTDDQLAALAELPPFADLHTLHLDDGNFSAPGLRALARGSAFPRLARLVLARTPVGPAGVAALAADARWPLAELNLWYCNVRDAGAEALARSPLADRLRVLKLGSDWIRAAGAKALARSRRLAGLRHLSLPHNPLGPDGLLAVATSPWLTNLTRLDVEADAFPRRGEKVPAAAAADFLGRLRAPRLRWLDARWLPAKVRGAKALAGNAHLANLTRLDLCGSEICDAGAAALVASPHLRGLIELNLTSNRIGAGAAALADPGVMPRLARCSLRDNPLPPGLRRRLRRRPAVEF